MLLAKDYPKAEPGKSPVRPASATADAELEELISGQAVPTPKATRARKAKAAAAPAANDAALAGTAAGTTGTAPVDVVGAPAAEAPTGEAPLAKGPARKSKDGVGARLRELDADQPHPAKHKPVEVNVKSSTSRKADKSGTTKVFVLDTNVLMHDPTSLFRFEEHDVYLPMMTLEELDNHKKGMSEVARNARQVARTLDALIANVDDDAIEAGIPLAKLGNKDARGRLYFQTNLESAPLPEGLPEGKADNQILGVVEALRQQRSGRDVVLVSKDINMRVKARALGLAAEDYQNDKVLEDGDLLYSGLMPLPQDFWTKAGKGMESWNEGPYTCYRVTGAIVGQFMINQFVYYEAPGEPSLFLRVAEIRDRTAVLKTLRDYGHAKNAVWGVTTRNREQNFAMNLLMDPEIDLVTLTGTAGTGKTLMALAAGLTQVLDERRYTEIIMTRATVSVGEDIGFLPGTEEEKMGPWMGALDDNLEFLAKGDGGNAGEWGRAATNELIRSRIKIKSMNFMRGRTFLNKYLILDEAQNLTPKQMKTLITRAGPGTKIVCMGNLAQIDTPYLTEGSSGLTYSVDRFKGWPHSGHITLARGERSRLADFASEVL